jgi:hypothetical protein
MRNGTAQFVEGRVSHFDPMPASGHGLESFSVEGVEFRYSDYLINAGFNNTQSQGGPIREGMPVKIWYFKDQILRLEVAKQ